MEKITLASKKKAIAKRIKSGTSADKWLKAIENKYGDKFRGWSVASPTITVTNVTPTAAVLPVNPKATGITNPYSPDPSQSSPEAYFIFQFVINSIGKYKSFYFEDVNSNQIIPIPNSLITVSNNTITLTIPAGRVSGSNLRLLSESNYKFFCVDFTGVRLLESGLSHVYPWNISAGSELFLPTALSFSDTITFTTAVSGGWSYYKGSTSISKDSNWAIRFSVTRASNGDTTNPDELWIGFVANNTNQTSGVTQQAVEGTIISLYDGRWCTDNTTINPASGLTKYATVFPVNGAEYTLCYFNKQLYCGSLTRMWHFQNLNTWSYTQTSMRLIVVTRGNVRTNTFTLKLYR